MMAFPSAPKHVWHLPQSHWPGFGEQAKVNLLLPTQELNSLTFFQNPPNPPRVLQVHDVIHISWLNFVSGIFILTSLNDTSSPCAFQHLRSSVHQTNSCAKRKVLSLTKHKGRIYKTKFLSHYITYLVLIICFHSL